MDRWNRLSHTLTHHAGTKRFFGLIVVLVAIWGVVGVIDGPNRTWELVVTCGVPILTLFMVIVLQHAQNRDGKATHLKLNELLLALEAPDNRLIRAGDLGDEELDRLGDQYAVHAEHADRAKDAKDAKDAEHAEHAGHAGHAGHAEHAEHAEHAKDAEQAEHAEHAEHADHAQHAKDAEQAEHVGS